MQEQTEQEHDPEAPARRRWPAVVGLVAGLAVLAGIVTVAVEPTLLTGSSSPTPAPAAPPSPGGMHDQERPAEVGELDPASRSDTEAAVRNGWRLTDHDEFDGTALDRTRWSPYTGETTGATAGTGPRTSRSATASSSSPAAGAPPPGWPGGAASSTAAGRSGRRRTPASATETSRCSGRTPRTGPRAASSTS